MMVKITKYKMFRSLKLLTLLFLLSAFLLLLNSKTVSAAYDGGNLIDNEVFLRSNSMSAADIQSFLESKGSGLATRSYKLDCYGPGSKERQLYTEAGAPCDQVIPASHIIYYASRIYSINPQAVLATLQKEQGLVTSPNPADWQLNNAMGYNCPTGGSCSSPGFYTQIDHGVWALRWHYERANGNMTWWSTSTSWTCANGSTKPKIYYLPGLYPGQDVRFYDEDGVHYRTHFVSNAATSALYCYTPHAFNNHRNGVPAQNVPSGTLCYSIHPEYGSVGRCYTGSYNFVKFFELWFGSTRSCDSSSVPASTLGVYNPAGGLFYQRYCHTSGPANLTLQFGNADWIPLSGDWNRDGVFTPGAYDPTSGWFYLRNTNNSGPADRAFQYGNIGWKPLVGDWNGNGYWSIGLYDPATSTFYLKDFNGGGGADYVASFGNSSWKPIAGDWDRNGSTTIGVYDPSASRFHLNDQIDNSAAEKTFIYGNTGWTPIAGDWDGNGWWSIGSYDPNAAVFYLRNLNSSGVADITVQYGNVGWLPVLGDWDGRR